MNETPTTGDRALDSLAKVPLCSQLDDRDRRKLAKLCTPKSFEPGDVLFEEGAMGLSLFIVTSGKVELYKTAGDKKVGLGTVDAGGVLGQIELLDDQPRAASAAALDATQCLLLTRDSFDTLVKKDPQIAWCLIPGMAGRIRDLQELAMETELAREERASRSAAKASAKADDAAAEEGEFEEEEEEEDEEPSDLESALFKMMRMQYGLMAGTARGVTDMAKVMETFLDSMAEETDFKTRDDWRDLLEKLPEAMVTATRSALDESEKVPEEMIDAYRRYSDAKD